jgi:hypothetical protein
MELGLAHSAFVPVDSPPLIGVDPAHWSPAFRTKFIYIYQAFIGKGMRGDLKVSVFATFR